MKQIFFCTFILFFSFASLDAALSLSQCQEKALEHNEKILLSDLRLEIEQDRIDEVRAMGYPTLAAEGQYVAASDSFHFLKENNRANARASLNVPLFNFGGMSNLLSAQKMNFESAFFQTQRTRQEVIKEVSKAYFHLLGMHKIAGIAEESIKTLKEQLRVSQDFHNEGMIHQSELLLVEVQLNQRVQDLIEAQQAESIALLRLNRLLGTDLSSSMEIEDQLEECQWNEEFLTYFENIRACHPQLLALEKKMEAAHLSAKGEKGALYPWIYAFSNYSTTKAYAFPYTHGVEVGLAFKWNLYDGGATRAKVSRRQKEALMLQHEYIALLQDVELGLRTSFLQVKTSHCKIPVTRKSVELAEQNLKNAQEHFQEGMVDTHELLSNEEKLAQAKSNYYQSLYDFHKARSELYFAAGVAEEDEK